VTLPPDAIRYKQVPREPQVFTRYNIPEGILNQPNMHTREGTWGVLIVFKGALRYNTHSGQNQTYYLVAPAKHVIEPMINHEIHPATKDFEFILELYKLPNRNDIMSTKKRLS